MAKNSKNHPKPTPHNPAVSAPATNGAHTLEMTKPDGTTQKIVVSKEGGLVIELLSQLNHHMMQQTKLLAIIAQGVAPPTAGVGGKLTKAGLLIPR